ncbi:hypothetical protein [Roseiflexus sp.]|uniref:hypothetical protein n=1 Tax=Roseiflexus sp. TaxID=2562120 RepID=UPI00398B46B3
MKNLNDGRQMQNVWYIPLCTGSEGFGQQVFSKDRTVVALVRADASLAWRDVTGSIHKIAARA